MRTEGVVEDPPIIKCPMPRYGFTVATKIDALLRVRSVAFAAFGNYEVVGAKMRAKLYFFDIVKHEAPSYGYLVLVANRDKAKENEDLMSIFLMS